MRFLAVSDLHYSDAPQGESDRAHRLSAQKLRYAIQNFSAGCDFIMNLGDTADYASEGRTQDVLFDEIRKIFDSSDMPYYSIIGNHDTATDKESFCKLMNSEGRYFAFTCGGFRCIVLDACLNDVENPMPDSEIEWDRCYIDGVQLEWLEKELSESQNPVLIFTHVPFIIQDESVENPHLVVNRAAAFELFDRYRNVAAVFSGHYHPGDYAVRRDVPYIIFPATGLAGENSFAVVTIEHGRITVDGHGFCASLEIHI